MIVRPFFTLPDDPKTMATCAGSQKSELIGFSQHDAVLDYYGRRLATCSSDKTIKIFDVEGESHKLVETLRG